MMTVWAMLFSMAAAAQVEDAFHGILRVTDPKMQKSLNGTWMLKVQEGIAEEMKVPETDESWKEIPVPGCWEAYGFCKPSYDSARPLTGFYRTSFNVPKAWKGQRVAICFDGVLYGYDFWVNGKHAGSWRSAYNTAIFDITPFLNPKADRQELAMKVISKFPGSDFDYNDDWAPNGIFRDVTLMAVPETHMADLTIHAALTGEVEVLTEVKNADRHTTVTHEILDAEGRLVGTDKVARPKQWTAETPYLYTLRTTLARKGKTLQTFHHRFGFRQLSIDGNVLKLNGQPIKLRGVTCHSTDPKTVKVIDEASILRDMKLMKEASVNYIRTSHYPREPRFYELADSLGFYVVDEVPFGFGDKNLSKPEFYPVLQQRAQATIRRDKNHPCVLIWSLGNENPLTDICISLGEYVKTKLDPSRPYCYPQVGSYFRRFFEGENPKGFPSDAPIYAPHYPTTGQIAGFYQHRDRPVIFTEYCHTLGISLEDHDRQWEIIERTPGIAGGSVWEWVDQGMPFRISHADSLSETDRKRAGGDFFGYEERVFTSQDQGFEMYGNKGTDGLLYADRTPLPNYYELQHNYARAFICDSVLSADGNILKLHLVNRFDFINLKDNVTFRWAYSEDRDTLANDRFSPECTPHGQTTFALQLPSSPQADRICLLHCEIYDNQGNCFLRQSLPVNPTDVTARLKAAFSQPSSDVMDAIQEGPLVRAGRKATMAEKIKVGDSRLEHYLLKIPEGTTAEGIEASVSMEDEGAAMHVRFSITPDSTERFLSELGVGFLLKPDIDRVQWIGGGPMPSYPGRFRANRYGLWDMTCGDLYFEGNRRGVDVALLTDQNGDGLLIVCRQGNISFEQTDRGIVLTYNAAVSGQGPKFARTAFPVIARNVGTVAGDFYLYRMENGKWPPLISRLFLAPEQVKPPFCPFKTQYDTYLMRYNDIVK